MITADGTLYQNCAMAFQALRVPMKFLMRVRKTLKEAGSVTIDGHTFSVKGSVKVVKRPLAESKPAKRGNASESCTVCGRVEFGAVVNLGFTRWRHGACEPGSASWCAYFAALPATKQTSEGRLIYEAAQAKERS
jgi:hypothetical protein